jgi:hypothetical protein
LIKRSHASRQQARQVTCVTCHHTASGGKYCSCIRKVTRHCIFSPMTMVHVRDKYLMRCKTMLVTPKNRFGAQAPCSPLFWFFKKLTF